MMKDYSLEHTLPNFPEVTSASPQKIRAGEYKNILVKQKSIDRPKGYGFDPERPARPVGCYKLPKARSTYRDFKCPACHGEGTVPCEKSECMKSEYAWFHPCRKDECMKVCPACGGCTKFIQSLTGPEEVDEQTPEQIPEESDEKTA